jgi:hypothetical protein
MKRIIVISATMLIATLFFMGVSAANILDTLPVHFNEGKVNPSSTLTLRLSVNAITVGRYYKISCDIYNPLYIKQYPICIMGL